MLVLQINITENGGLIMKKRNRKVLMYFVALFLVCAVSVFAFGEASAANYNGFIYEVTDGAATIIGIDSTVTGEVIIPSEINGYTVKAIDGKAFELNESITSVTVPDSVTTIGYNAFSFCTNLKSIKLSSNLTEIEYETFWGCESLKHIDIPYGVKRIGAEAFTQSGLESISIPNSVTEIARRAFSVTHLGSVEIPASVEEIGNLVFSGCEDLREVKIYNPDCVIYDSYDTIYHEAVIYGHPGSTAQDYAVEYDMAFIGIHSYTNTETKEATCTETGTITETCSICGEVKTTTIPLKDHTDTNGDGKCDMCGKVLTADKPADPTKNCSCNCHKSGILGFFFKVLLVFQRIFGSNKICGCGINHY